MDIKKVDGQLYWHVYVVCPHCHKDIDLVDMENDYEHALAQRVWSSEWLDTGLGYDCPLCGQPFELKDVEY